ncbi:hypothetical protein AOCH_005963 [Aspergillus ochraceoroseus]|uniref:Uncharacterized protein n=1 Tax=Aspergillus ochraceoroseus TaxID=138278 RepID=A0A0F8WDA2_9EURO|nr:hypothetical protein AOCH_005963 [Aspergillus ochraceoroseus]
MPLHLGKKRTSTEASFSEEQISQPRKQSQLGLKPAPPYQTTFWVQLSRIQLTKRALDELNRRSSNSSPSPKLTTQPLSSPSSRDELARLKRFSRLGGPDLRELIGYQHPLARRGRSRSGYRQSNGPPKQAYTPHSSLRTASEKHSSAYDANFEQALIDVGIYPVGYPGHRDRRPKNLDVITNRLERRRESISQFDDEIFDDFVQRNHDARSEKTVMSNVFPIVRGSADIPFGEDKLFGNLEPLADGVVSAKPDFYDGSLVADCDKKIRQLLSSSIIPSTQEHLPIAPNFFCEGKGPDGSHAVGERQALYNGAVGARAMHTLQGFGREATYDNNAYTITSLYHCGHLQLYTVHPLKSAHPARETDYQMTLLRSYSLKDTCETFRQGVQAFRNARDWAKEHRDHLISTANAIAPTLPHLLPYAAGTDFQDSDTSTDELAQLPTSRKRVLSHGNQSVGPADREKSSRTT